MSNHFFVCKKCGQYEDYKYSDDPKAKLCDNCYKEDPSWQLTNSRYNNKQRNIRNTRKTKTSKRISRH